MAEQQYIVNNIQHELIAKTIPATTVWNRLEGRPRTINFDRALKAEVRDALWFLSRQWQMGEFLGDDAGTPILNPGEAAILCFGAVRRRPWEWQGEIALREVTTLSLSFDHRLVDGEQGSKFLATVAEVLADPLALIALS